MSRRAFRIERSSRSLRDCVQGVAADVLDQLRSAVTDLGVNRVASTGAPAEIERVIQLEHLAARLAKDSEIPGLTVNQRKDREWDRVGAILTRAQRALLAARLHELEDEHCIVYVALTRPKRRCVRLDGDSALDQSA